MALKNTLFNSKKNSGPSGDGRISLQTLKQLIPLRSLSDDKLSAFASEQRAENLPQGTVLFKQHAANDAAIYLIRGSVSISTENKVTYDIEAGSSKANFPICSGRQHTTTAIAKTDITILRVSNKIMSGADNKRSHELSIPENMQQNRLLSLFAQHFVNENLHLLTLPDVATQLQQAMAKTDIGVAEAVKIIHYDPVVAGKLIDVANCPLYLALHPATNLLEAVKRIGLNATRNLVTSFYIKEIYRHDTADIKQLMTELWQESIQLASLCYVLAGESRQYSPEQALLGGLVCDIGAIPFVHFIADLPKEYRDPEEIRQAIPVIKNAVSAMILNQWNFTEEFVAAALESDDWYQDRQSELNLTDLIVLARLHRSIVTHRHAAHPPIASIPAASKLKKFELSPERSLLTIHRAKSKLNQTLSMFNQ